MRKSKVIVLGFAVVIAGCQMCGGLVTLAQNYGATLTQLGVPFRES